MNTPTYTTWPVLRDASPARISALRVLMTLIAVYGVMEGCAKQETITVADPVHETAALVATVNNKPPSEAQKRYDAALAHLDIDCDGREDAAQLEYFSNRAVLSVTLTRLEERQSLQIPMANDPEWLEACSGVPLLAAESTDYDISRKLGSNPPGFVASTSCKGLKVLGDECNTIHVFWDHDSSHLDWWRL